MKIFRFKRGGVHPASDKERTAGMAPVELAQPDQLTILTSQSIGAPSRVCVAVGASVARGQKIAEAGGFVGADIHSPADAVVKRIEKMRDLSGYWQDAIVLEVDKAADTADGEATDMAGLPDYFIDFPQRDFAAKLREISAEEIVKATADAGIVGMGGAAFPTRVKLTVTPQRRIEFMLLNGAECEPCLTCDDRMMRQRPEDILRGALLMAKACGARTIIVGIEANKPEALAAMREAAERAQPLAAEINRTISVCTLRTRYPQGSEKQLIEALTDRIVPTGGLPADAGCLVDNVATAFALYQAVMGGVSLTRRIVTVTGPELQSPGNFIVDCGTTYRALIEAAGGMPEDTEKVISGGPMMGRAVANLDAPVVKATSGVVVMPREMAHRRSPEPCIRCAKCVEVCPMGLEPYMLLRLSELHLSLESEARGVMNCLECGCCSYICPSDRPLLDGIRLTKGIIKRNHSSKK